MAIIEPQINPIVSDPGVDQFAGSEHPAPQPQPQRQVDEFGGFAEAAAAETRRNEELAEEESRLTGGGGSSSLSGLSADQARTRSAGTRADAQNLNTSVDWRVRLSLAKNAKYLYLSDTPGILKPLKATGGVIFPYTPQINITYAAHYDGTDLTHSNYKIWQYKSSSVDSIQVTCDFTAQDTNEANYILAVIHFFRSATKMFYGQDTNPKAGTPPPLCYLTGLGQFQFNNHPLVISNFTYSLPNNVDYIRASSFPGTPPGVSTSGGGAGYSGDPSTCRPLANNVTLGGEKAPATWLKSGSASSGTKDPTYVPTKLQIAFQAYPIVTRDDISNKFSFKEYASGALLNRPSGGGIW